jgi:hypothetical protein
MLNIRKDKNGNLEIYDVNRWTIDEFLTNESDYKNNYDKENINLWTIQEDLRAVFLYEFSLKELIEFAIKELYTIIFLYKGRKQILEINNTINFNENTTYYKLYNFLSYHLHTILKREFPSSEEFYGNEDDYDVEEFVEG